MTSAVLVAEKTEVEGRSEVGDSLTEWMGRVVDVVAEGWQFEFYKASN